MNYKQIPKVCICVPAYNSEETIGKTLESLLKQSYKNIIIKIIDNCSSDSTAKIVEQYMYKDQRVQLISFDKLVPAAENFDRCIEFTEGDYTCIFHSDDIYLPKIVEKEVEFLENHRDVGAVFAYANVINENDVIISALLPNKDLERQYIYNFDELFPLILKYNNCFVTPSAMVRTKIYKEEIIKHKRKESFNDAFDVDVWLRILKKHKVGFIFERLMSYRLSIHSMSFRKLLEYDNTITDSMFNVLETHMIEGKAKHLLQNVDYINLKTRNKLGNVMKAYFNADHDFAKKMIRELPSENLSSKNEIIKFILSVVIYIPSPKFMRKLLIYVKYYGIMKGQFNRIQLDK
ncbi:glycosyltransferase family 2 protein [Phascolarctobacterium sp.]